MMSLKGRIEILHGDITTLKVDAIVNAANKTLLGGGGVDGAIHAKAGKNLLKACVLLNGCEPGEAKITKGYALQAKYIIHTVGPVWKGGDSKENELLANCYRNSMNIALKNKLSSIAFPNISTGVYGFPKKDAAIIAKKEIEGFLIANKSLKKVFFVIFDDDNFRIYSELFDFSS
jgi:O-acetyl-ADP-ribose deacetylase (regulator of RNase III)